MGVGSITGHIDVALVVLYAFWIFFIGLIFYIRREDRREGYPLEADTTGALEPAGAIWMPNPKPYKLPSGKTVYLPNADNRDTRPVAAKRMAPWPGAPLIPTGDPMKDAVGPAAYAERSDHPDMTVENEPKILPLRVLPNYSLSSQDKDPRGMPVVGCDKKEAGTIKDVWIDRAELCVRYLEVELPDKSTVMLPKVFADIQAGFVAEILDSPKIVDVTAITAAQFADVPRLKNPDQVTLLEEDKIQGYYSGGTLYATPSRQEPLI